MTDYLWKDILTKEKLTLIIENYAQVVIEVDENTKKKKEKQIFPRYCMNCLMVSLICLSRIRRSVTTITESSIGLYGHTEE